MEEYQDSQNRHLLSNVQRPLPNATTVLVLGILSIVVCFVCGIIALIISSGDKRLYEQNPELYTTSSHDFLRAGRICSIISLCLLGVGIIVWVFVMVFVASTAMWR